jgi:hypothetical protein
MEYTAIRAHIAVKPAASSCAVTMDRQPLAKKLPAVYSKRHGARS